MDFIIGYGYSSTYFTLKNIEQFVHDDFFFVLFFSKYFELQKRFFSLTECCN